MNVPTTFSNIATGAIPPLPDRTSTRTMLTIGPNGSITSGPTKIRARTGDWVCWHITNSTDRPVVVKVRDFLFTSPAGVTKLLDGVIQWFTPDCAKVAANGTAAIVGLVVHAPARGGGFQNLSYTIEVNGTWGPGDTLARVDYDPDFEVAPPS